MVAASSGIFGKPSYRVDAISAELIEVIAERAARVSPILGTDAVFKVNAIKALLVFVHANVCKLDFKELASYPDAEMERELILLLDHTNCVNYKFNNGYTPRCAL